METRNFLADFPVELPTVLGYLLRFHPDLLPMTVLVLMKLVSTMNHLKILTLFAQEYSKYFRLKRLVSYFEQKWAKNELGQVCKVQLKNLDFALLIYCLVLLVYFKRNYGTGELYFIEPLVV